MTNHYLTLIQDARRTSESLVELRSELPAEVVERQAKGARANLTEGLAVLAALPSDPLRGGAIVTEMVARAEASLAELGA